MNRRERLRQMLATIALTEGRFTLSSGSTSDYYIDAKLVTQDPEGLGLVADAFLEILERYNVDAVGGPVQGAVPIATAIAMRSWESGDGIPAFFVRPDAKQHGTKKVIEGPVANARRLAIVDDVITSGRSVAEALEAIRAEYPGVQVVVVVSLVDREAGAERLIRQHCQDYEHVFTITELRPTTDTLDRLPERIIDSGV